MCRALEALSAPAYHHHLRSWRNIFRQPQLIIARVFQVLSFGITLTLFYARFEQGQPYVRNRIGAPRLPLHATPFLPLCNLDLYPCTINPPLA